MRSLTHVLPRSSHNAAFCSLTGLPVSPTPSAYPVRPQLIAGSYLAGNVLSHFPVFGIRPQPSGAFLFLLPPRCARPVLPKVMTFGSSRSRIVRDPRGPFCGHSVEKSRFGRSGRDPRGCAEDPPRTSGALSGGKTASTFHDVTFCGR